MLAPAMPKPDPSKTRRTAADAVVFDERGRVLLQCRSDFKQWGLPGGAVEVGETLEQAVRREVKEETGYDVEVVRLVGAYSDPTDTTVRYPNGDVAHYVSLTFECRVVGGRPRTDEESTDLAWFEVEALPPDVMPQHVPRVRDAAARRPAAFVR
jgi:ADP-ribose pyrophosphatase YjhB (NUDIX family)